MVARPASNTSTPCTETFSRGTAGKFLGFGFDTFSMFRAFLEAAAALKVHGV